MFIDSPNFPRRKIVNHQSQLMAGFGYDRIQLSNFVTNELNNNHKDDAAILQKFRKQAQQYKKNLLRRKHSPVSPSSPFLTPNFKSSQLYQSFKQPIIEPQNLRGNFQHTFPQNTYKNQQNQRIEQSYDNSPRKSMILQQAVKGPDQTSKHLIKMVEKKDRKIEKQAKIIHKNQLKINDLRKRIQVLQRQNKIRQNDRIAALQQNSYQKLKGYINSISNKLGQNYSLLSQNLPEASPIKNKSMKLQKQYISQHDKFQKSLPIKNRKTLTPLAKHTQSQQNPEPKIAYNYKITTEQELKNKKAMNSINEMVDNLGNSRNRLDAISSYF